jgi:hypothetical protein
MRAPLLVQTASTLSGQLLRVEVVASLGFSPNPPTLSERCPHPRRSHSPDLGFRGIEGSSHSRAPIRHGNHIPLWKDPRDRSSVLQMLWKCGRGDQTQRQRENALSDRACATAFPTPRPGSQQRPTCASVGSNHLPPVQQCSTFRRDATHTAGTRMHSPAASPDRRSVASGEPASGLVVLHQCDSHSCARFLADPPGLLKEMWTTQGVRSRAPDGGRSVPPGIRGNPPKEDE